VKEMSFKSGVKGHSGFQPEQLVNVSTGLVYMKLSKNVCICFFHTFRD